METAALAGHAGVADAGGGLTRLAQAQAQGCAAGAQLRFVVVQTAVGPEVRGRLAAKGRAVVQRAQAPGAAFQRAVGIVLVAASARGVGCGPSGGDEVFVVECGKKFLAGDGRAVHTELR